jgi:hypothetical protein
VTPRQLRTRDFPRSEVIRLVRPLDNSIKNAASSGRRGSPREIVGPQVDCDGRQAQSYADPENRRMMDRSSVARSWLHSITVDGSSRSSARRRALERRPAGQRTNPLYSYCSLRQHNWFCKTAPRRTALRRLSPSATKRVDPSKYFRLAAPAEKLWCDRSAGLQKSQDRKAGSGRGEVLERMPAHD